MELTTCPRCGFVAEIEHRGVRDGVSGPVEHAAVQCVVGHRCLVPVAALASHQVAPSPTFARAPLVRVRRQVPRGDGRPA